MHLQTRVMMFLRYIQNRKTELGYVRRGELSLELRNVRRHSEEMSQQAYSSFQVRNRLCFLMAQQEHTYDPRKDNQYHIQVKG